ncbi:MAG: YegP family protein [Thermoanaerobaculia bacterium]
MAAKFEIKKSVNAQYFFNLKAANGEVILTSEEYTEKESATKGIDSVKKNAPDDARYERKTAKDDKPFFVLTATNGQTLGRSEMYDSKAAMETGIASVKKNAPEAKTEDLA